MTQELQQAITILQYSAQELTSFLRKRPRKIHSFN
ncbi:hypothetical protein ACI2OX_02465 [Bacillus sp. N9]